jgi:hypothetical protein
VARSERENEPHENVRQWMRGNFLSDVRQLNGARGRDRTTDTAIFSRMLYQLSYPGTARRGGQGAPVYSQAGGPCPPGFAFGYAGRGAASYHQPNGWEIRLILPLVTSMERSNGKCAAGRSSKSPACTMLLWMGLFSIFY